MKLQKNIILYMVMAVLSISFAMAQNQQIQGRVLDESNKPVSGVTILNASTNRALTATKDNGEFTVTVPANTTLIFRGIGFTERRIKINVNQTSLTVRLSATDNQVEEVVVRGYVARSKEKTTGSSYSLGEKDIKDNPAINIESLMQGKVPGLNIQVNTGAPGFRGSTQIRGLSTLSTQGTGNESILMPTSPLYVIDGVPMDADRASEFGLQQQGPGISPLSLIPPEDVESIEILKDAQATSLYGSRGAYGVIIINTKRGNSEVPRINYTHSSFMRSIPKLRETLGGNMERNLKLLQIYTNARTQGELDKIMQTPSLADSLNSYFNNSTNWQGLFYQNTFNQNHNFSMDGGNQQLSYKANLNFYDETGVIKNTGFTRYSSNLRMDYRPSRRFEFVGQVFAQLGKMNKGDGTGILQTGVASGGQSSTLLPPPGFFTASSDYVAAIRTRNDNKTKLIKPFIEAGVEIIDNLRFRTTLSYELSSGTEEKFSPAASSGQFSEVYAFNNRYSQFYSRNNLNYSKTLNEDHDLFFSIFNEIIHVTNQNSVITQRRTPNDQFEGPLGFDGFFSNGGGILSFKNEKALSFAFAGNYSYKSRYVLDLTYRLDGSSLNGFENLYTKNPSIGLKWNIHREDWIKGLPWINTAALRGTWGVNVMPTATLDRIYGKYNIYGNYNQQTGIGIDSYLIPNPDLKPTTSMQYNLGFDLIILNNKIDIIYDTYYKRTENLYQESYLNNTTGFSTLSSNEGGLVNYGHEVSLRLRPLKGDKFFWMFSINGAYNRDVLLQLPSIFNGQLIRWDGSSAKQHILNRVGTHAFSNYVLVNRGVYATDADVPVDPRTGLRYRTPDGTFFQAGDPIWVDQNGDYILDDRDYTRSGSAQPNFIGGIQNEMSYKGISLTIAASYTAGRTIFNNALAERMRLLANPYGLQSVVPLDDLDMWRQDGDIAKYPNAYDFSRAGNINPLRNDQTLWEENGSYLKINQVSLAYNFDREFLRRYRLQRFRVYATMDNVYTFSKYSGPNPEGVTSLGRDLSNGYPVPRGYALGLNLSF